MTSADDAPTEVARASGVMALGTIASRGTGFLRVVAMAAALGFNPVSDAYTVANTTPNIVYELLLGGLLTSIVIPLLVQAARDDDDDGVAFAQLLLTGVVVILGGAVVIGMVAAPGIARLFEDDPEQRRLIATLLRWFLPQIFFYGVGATVTAVLNLRRKFGVPMAAPALNNLVVIATAIVFVFMPGPRPPTVGGLTGAQIAVLGAGTTLGVVIMTLALLPSLRGTGFTWRWRLHRHPALRRAARLGAWMVVYVVANQVGLLVIIRLAKAVSGGYTAYAYAFILFQLPHAIITVSIVSALLPRLAEHAVDGALDRLRADLSYGLRTVAAMLVPAAVGLVVLHRQLASLVLSWGVATPEDAKFAGRVLAAFAVGLLSFSAFQMLVRTFQALQDTKTVAMVNIAANAVNVLVDVILFLTLDGDARIIGLAVGHATAYTFGALAFARLLSTRIDGMDGYRVVRTFVRLAVASAIGGLAAWGVARGVAGVGGTGRIADAAAVALAAGVGAALYASAASRMKVTELPELWGIVRTQVRRPR